MPPQPCDAGCERPGSRSGRRVPTEVVGRERNGAVFLERVRGSVARIVCSFFSELGQGCEALSRGKGSRKDQVRFGEEYSSFSSGVQREPSTSANGRIDQWKFTSRALALGAYRRQRRPKSLKGGHMWTIQPPSLPVPSRGGSAESCVLGTQNWQYTGLVPLLGLHVFGLEGTKLWAPWFLIPFRKVNSMVSTRGFEEAGVRMSPNHPQDANPDRRGVNRR